MINMERYNKTKVMSRVMLWIVVILVYFTMAIATNYNNIDRYPVIITDKYTNHTLAKELVYSIPAIYYSEVDVVKFVQDGGVWCAIDEYHPTHNCGGRSTTHWYWWDWSAWYNSSVEHGSCFDVEILTTVNFEVLQHELGHVHEQCVLRLDVHEGSELYAKGFRVVR